MGYPVAATNLQHQLNGALHPLGTEEKERAEDIQGNVMVGGGIAERIVGIARETMTEEKEREVGEGAVAADRGKGREATGTDATGEIVTGIVIETETRGKRRLKRRSGVGAEAGQDQERRARRK